MKPCFEAVFSKSFLIWGNKKGEGRFSFTFLRREISPAKVEQQSCCIMYVS
jgi:hypothetical protein